ncbi:MAG: hypothetical protein O3C40_27495 [Planctomycetota bacterium]|nr:hypothetical protein [Planctomycetota bacterium]
MDSKITTNPDGVFQATVSVEREQLANVRVSARSADGSQLGFFRFPWDGGKTASDAIVIRLEPTKVARVKVVDATGKPIPNANVGIQLESAHAVGRHDG